MPKVDNTTSSNDPDKKKRGRPRKDTTSSDSSSIENTPTKRKRRKRKVAPKVQEVNDLVDDRSKLVVAAQLLKETGSLTSAMDAVRRADEIMRVLS